MNQYKYLLNGLGASKAVKKLRKKTDVMKDKIRLQEAKIAELTARRDQLTGGMDGFGLFKSVERMYLEQSIDVLKSRIQKNELLIASLDMEVAQLESQMSVTATLSELDAQMESIDEELAVTEAQDIPEESEIEIVEANAATNNKFLLITAALGVATFIGWRILKTK